jgi:hypothetical protein
MPTGFSQNVAKAIRKVPRNAVTISISLFQQPSCSELPLRLVANHDGAATPSYINVIGFGPSM